ncbi:MAG TPA: Gmad2 immunoglobulin-like domain-containing protein, partial [Roseiflexaceae bacterium]|nr:Gmad2 immunoglobulin-like domain-containing protein [Roseiflexaceae bacterium]
MNGKRFSLAQLLRLLSLVGLSGALAACASFGAPQTETPPTLVVGQLNAQGTPVQGYPAPTARPPAPTTVPPTAVPPATPLPPQQISIDTPAPGTPIGSPVTITGRALRPPRNGVLNYRFTDNAGRQLGSGEFPVGGTPGQPTSFTAVMNFDLPRDGGPVSIELFERTDASGQGGASAVLGTVVEAQYQDIFIDTPSAGRVVGSPMVITGRTMREPAQGVLSYRVLNSARQQIGDGT